MPNPTSKRLLETSAIIVGYAMSRLDKSYLTARDCPSWKEAFRQAGVALDVSPGSFKNLRDEFDPVHGNARLGWHNRPLRASRQRILGELCDVSDAALVELVSRILARDQEAVADAVTVLATPAKIVPNVAERLLTGRRAEEHFLEHCEQIIRVARAMIVDCRFEACGFDFGVRGRNRMAVEVKGLKQKRGDILFTDREWTEAKARREDYLLVVVGNLEDVPLVRTIYDPSAILRTSCNYHTSIAVTWRARVGVT